MVHSAIYFRRKKLTTSLPLVRVAPPCGGLPAGRNVICVCAAVAFWQRFCLCNGLLRCRCTSNKKRKKTVVDSVQLEGNPEHAEIGLLAPTFMFIEAISNPIFHTLYVFQFFSRNQVDNAVDPWFGVRLRRSLPGSPHRSSSVTMTKSFPNRGARFPRC